jgi:hypothetical protein
MLAQSNEAVMSKYVKEYVEHLGGKDDSKLTEKDDTEPRHPFVAPYVIFDLFIMFPYMCATGTEDW